MASATVVTGKPDYLQRGFMMLRTSARLTWLLALTISFTAAAKETAPTCLQHLGGGYGDVACYSGLRTDLVAESEQIYKRLRSTIPAGNLHARLLDDYMATQDRSAKYCELQRNAGAHWESEHDGSMFPAIYEQCLYSLRKSQNEFLKSLIEMATW